MFTIHRRESEAFSLTNISFKEYYIYTGEDYVYDQLLSAARWSKAGGGIH